MAQWEEFTVVIGGAAAALVGLLFVAVTLRVDVIAAENDLRSRATQTLTLFVTVLVTAVLLTVPSQPEPIIGVELIVLAIAAGIVLQALGRRARKAEHTEPVAQLLDRTSPTVITTALIALAGVLLIVGVDWGTYLLVPAMLAALVGGVINAWLFLVRIPKEDKPGDAGGGER